MATAEQLIVLDLYICQALLPMSHYIRLRVWSKRTDLRKYFSFKYMHLKMYIFLTKYYRTIIIAVSWPKPKKYLVARSQLN